MTLPLKLWLGLSKDRTIKDDAAPESVPENLWVLPCHSVASADWTRVFPAVRDNGRARGFSFVHNEPVTEPRALLGWIQEADRPFILCTLRSCTPLDGGSYRVRLLVENLIRLEPKNVEAVRRALEERSANGCS